MQMQLTILEVALTLAGSILIGALGRGKGRRGEGDRWRQAAWQLAPAFEDETIHARTPYYQSALPPTTTSTTTSTSIARHRKPLRASISVAVVAISSTTPWNDRQKPLL